MYGTNHSSKESLYKKEKEILIMTEKHESQVKQIKGLGLRIQEMEEEKQSLVNVQNNLEI